MEIKHKINLMEHLDNIESYNGRWKTLWKYRDVIRMGEETQSSEKEADEYAFNYLSSIKNKHGNQMFKIISGTTGALISIVKADDVKYLGAIPVK